MSASTSSSLVRVVEARAVRPVPAFGSSPLPLSTHRGVPVRRFLALLVYYATLLAALFATETALSGTGFRQGPPGGAPWRVAVLTMGSMIGAVTLTLPVAWVRWIASAAGGKDRTVLETLVMLPAAVSAIVMIVQSDITLALSLAGIVAAVRFRNNVKESADAVYVFVAIGLGLAAGTQAMVPGVVMSAVFSLIVLASAKVKAAGDLTPADEPTDSGPSFDDPKRKAVLLVHAAPSRPAWHAVEDVLRKRAKRWRLVEPPADAASDAPLEYRIRLKRKTSPLRLVTEIKTRGGSDILAAELRPA